MTVAGAYGDLLRLDRPIVTTREAASRWGTAQRAAGQRLRTMEEAGLVRRLRRGLWALDPEIEPFAVPPYLTAPLPAYVSFWSALSKHGLIEQIPRRIAVASLARPRQIPTSVGAYDVHHLAPPLFTGYEGSDRSGYVATAEKALFDTVYVRAASGSRAYFSELSLPSGFDRAQLATWTDLIDSARLRTLVSRHLEEALQKASSSQSLS
jgi:predicted transcriptional regulator of viral defense system